MEAQVAQVNVHPRSGRALERLAAAAGAMYVVLLVAGDDFVNGADEAPVPDASMREVAAYLASADTTSFWVGRFIGLLGVCALLVFVAYVSHVIRRAEGSEGILSRVTLGAGVLAAGLQFAAAPAQFAAVQRFGEGIDPQVARALIDVQSASFILSWFPLALVFGCAACAGLRYGLLPRWLTMPAAVISIGLLVGLATQPAEAAFLAFMCALLWLIAASVALVRRVPSPGSNR
jgi:hypothetical protein